MRRLVLSVLAIVVVVQVGSNIDRAQSNRIVSTRALVYDVRSFGAKGDGTTLDTRAINKAIEAAAASGGGTVSFPAGTYLSVSIQLRSNITLQLNPGAIILAADP